MALLPVDDAITRLLEGAAPKSAERIELHQCAGRVLAEPVKALRTQPPFDASAMDGYAVRAQDATLGAVLKVIGEAPAGKAYRGEVGPGEAVRIFTGAPVPKGGDAIIIQEDVRVSGSSIEVGETARAGRHIRRRGLDFGEGDVLLPAGRVLDPAALSLAAAANHPTLNVVAKPLVAIIATGDELLPPGSTPGPDQIIASNAYGVAATLEAAGAAILDLGIAPDDRAEIGKRINVARAAGADIIVTLGGASVGDHDLVHAVLTEAGMDLSFWKIAMRPGKPLMFGMLGDVRCIGLPGNPVASLLCAEIFIKPLVAALAGRTPGQDWRDATLSDPMPANDQRQDYVRAFVTHDADGHLKARPYQVQDSSMLRILAESNAVIVRAPFAPSADAGEPCRLLILRDPQG